jgi:hypothetical protein
MSGDEVVWSRAHDVAFVDDGERVVLLRLAEASIGRPSLLSTEGAAVWRCLAEPRTVSEVCGGADDRVALSRLLEALAQAGFVAGS